MGHPQGQKSWTTTAETLVQFAKSLAVGVPCWWCHSVEALQFPCTNMANGVVEGCRIGNENHLILVATIT